MPLFRNRELAPRETILVKHVSRRSENWFNEQVSSKNRRTYSKNEANASSDGPKPLQVENGPQSSPSKKLKASEQQDSAVPLFIDVEASNPSVPSNTTNDAFIDLASPRSTSSDDTIISPCSPIRDSPNESAQGDQSFSSTDELSSPRKAQNPNIRIIYDGVIRRFHLDLSCSINSQIPDILKLMEVTAPSDRVFFLVWEKLGRKLDMNVQPVTFPENVDTRFDVFRLASMSKEELEEEKNALEEFNEPVSSTNAPNNPIDDYDIEDDRFRVKVRLTYLDRHSSCSTCQSACSNCKVRTAYFETNRLNRRKDTIFKCKLESSSSSLENLFTKVREHVITTYIGGDSVKNHEWLTIQYEFDGDEVIEKATPAALDMEPESIIDAKIKDIRCNKSICSCNPEKRTRGRKAKANSNSNPANSSHSTPEEAITMMTVVDLD